LINSLIQSGKPTRLKVFMVIVMNGCEKQGQDFGFMGVMRVMRVLPY
jgi:hypothetical protein